MGRKRGAAREWMEPGTPPVRVAGDGFPGKPGAEGSMGSECVETRRKEKGTKAQVPGAWRGGGGRQGGRGQDQRPGRGTQSR